MILPNPASQQQVKQLQQQVLLSRYLRLQSQLIGRKEQKAATLLGSVIRDIRRTTMRKII